MYAYISYTSSKYNTLVQLSYNVTLSNMLVIPNNFMHMF